MTSLAPTRKWWATQVTALAALLTMYATTGTWDTEETVAAIGLFSQAAIAWLVPNNPDNEAGMTVVELLLLLILVVLVVALFVGWNVNV